MFAAIFSIDAGDHFPIPPQLLGVVVPVVLLLAAGDSSPCHCFPGLYPLLLHHLLVLPQLPGGLHGADLLLVGPADSRLLHALLLAGLLDHSSPELVHLLQVHLHTGDHFPVPPQLLGVLVHHLLVLPQLPGGLHGC